MKNFLGSMKNVLLMGAAVVTLQLFAVPAPQIINIGNAGEPKDLDPHIVTGVPEFRILMNVFEGLVGKDPKTLLPVPGVAESWKISKDGKVYTFKLRKNAKWSNGDAVTAQDFIYSWTRLLTPSVASEYNYQGFYIKGGKDFNSGKTKDASQLGLKAIDANTLEVTLENPTPFFLGLLFHHSLLPVHKATVEKFGTKWTRPENIVSNGPFVVKKWEINKVISLAKNPNYWDAAKVVLTQANFFPVDKIDTEEKMFRSKELHTTYEIPQEKLPTWQKDTSGVFISEPYLGTYYYLLNTTQKPLDNKDVRKALSLAIDREKLVKFVTRAGQLPGTVLTPPGTGGYKPTPRLPSDLSQLQKARELLVKAGYPGGKGFPKMDILYNTNDNHKKIAETIQQMWKENLGIDVGLYNQEWKVYLDNQAALNYQIARKGWIADYNDPNTFLDMFVTGGGNNNTGWSNKKYDSLIGAAAKESSQAKRFKIFQQAEDILLDELPIMPIYIYTRNYLLSKDVQGWYPNVEDIHPLKLVSIVPKT